jgi:hypothetical protein
MRNDFLARQRKAFFNGFGTCAWHRNFEVNEVLWQLHRGAPD